MCREHGISTAIVYKWRFKYGAMHASLIAGMKGLEEESRRLKRLYVEALT
jgi:putative transposase